MLNSVNYGVNKHNKVTLRQNCNVINNKKNENSSCDEVKFSNNAFINPKSQISFGISSNQWGICGFILGFIASNDPRLAAVLGFACYYARSKRYIW
jgi:hypothetical protein